MKRLVLPLAGWVGLALAAPATASAKQVKFVGVHPIAVDVGGGFCYIEAPHVHIYAPARADVLYREHDDAYYFVGDPVPYGYDGPKRAYYGHHPVAVDVVLEEDELDGDEIEYCYLEGPHYHYYEPPVNAKFTVKGGVYWYVGELPVDYERDRPKLVRINAVYKPLRYARPVVVVAPPPDYHGVVVEVEAPHAEIVADPPVVRAGVGVGIGVEVEVPAPSIELRVGVPGVIIVDDDHHHGHGHGHGHGKRKVKVKGRGRF